MSTDLFGLRVLDLDHERRRVRFRVFVVYYEPSWGTGDLLPNDPSFFFRALWEGAQDSHERERLTDLIGWRELLDEEWVDRHTHRFVSHVERLATRNHPVDDDAFESLAMFYYERDGGWQDEHLLAQGDYDVQVTDSRWMATLRPGQSWGTTFYPSNAAPPPEKADGLEAEYAALAAGGDTGAAFALGWLRQDRGDTEGAALAYRQAAGTDDQGDRAKALLYLAALHAGQDDTHAARAAYEDALACEAVWTQNLYRSHAALGLGALLRASGDEDGAQAAYALAEEAAQEARGLSLVREARRLANTETWVERTCRALQETGRDDAERTLADACGSAAAARFGVALTERENDRARTELAGLTDPAELETAAAIGLDLAAVRTREDDDAAVNEAMLAVMATGRPAEGYRRALAEGLVGTVSGPMSKPEKVVFHLLRLLKDSGDLDGVTRLAQTAEPAHPRVAASAFHFLGVTGIERDDPQRAAGWLRRGAALTEPDEDAAAGPAYDLGVVLAGQDDPDGARDAFGQAENGFVYLGDKARAACRLAELLNGQGDRAAASAAWTRAAFWHARLELGSDEHAAWSIRKLGDLLAEAGESTPARQAHHLADETQESDVAPAAGACAAFHYARWIQAGGHREQALTLLRAISDDSGPYAVKAARALRAATREPAVPGADGADGDARRAAGGPS
ncbi:hypothetical protein [Spirillospora sp. NBC_01491]|uniref:hypothetical protein n=1 Tax=Spirillospora sp. NBC_01491 TaxID=2976007 RepID=UPI002E337B2B|nr:hypothetical protein [Spirillospora sp. NBC_01491]